MVFDARLKSYTEEASWEQGKMERTYPTAKPTIRLKKNYFQVYLNPSLSSWDI